MQPKTKNPLQSMPLAERIAARNPRGLSLEDASQLCLWIFCTLDVLPSELRSEPLGRIELAETFSRLAREGLVNTSDRAPSSPAYWDSLIDQLLANGIALDRDFRAQFPSLL